MKFAAIGPVLLLLVVLTPGIANAQATVGQSAAVGIVLQVDCQVAWTKVVRNAPLLDSLSFWGGNIDIIKGGRANKESAVGDMYTSAMAYGGNAPTFMVTEVDGPSLRNAVVQITPLGTLVRAMRIERSLTALSPGVCLMQAQGFAHTSPFVDFAALMQEGLDNVKAVLEGGQPIPHSFPRREGQ